MDTIVARRHNGEVFFPGRGASVIRFCLRYQFMDLALADGDFIAGRVPECDLVLDDGLVSRRHALFRVDGGQVEVEDLGSRNGVLVNGKPINRPTRLVPGDEIRIGSQNLLLKETNGVPTKTDAGTRELRICNQCQIPVAFDAPCPRCGGAHDDVPANRGPSFEVLARIAQKAMGLGRTSEAERIANSMFESLVGQRARNQGTRDGDITVACECALSLAEATKRGSWLDYPLRLHEELEQVLQPGVIDRLYQLAGALRYNNPAQLRAYLTWLRGQAGRLDATQRFSLSRLEGLERMLASH